MEVGVLKGDLALGKFCFWLLLLLLLLLLIFVVMAVVMECP
jgi:hypothetical protein